MAETNEELANEISRLDKEASVISDQIRELLVKIFENRPVSLDDKVIVTDHKGQATDAFIVSIRAAKSGKYWLRFNKAKKDGTCSLITYHIYSDERITRVSDGFDVKSIMA